MTTVPPTTLLPTSLLPTSLAPTTFPGPVTVIVCEPLDITFGFYFVHSHFPPAPRDWGSDIHLHGGAIEITFSFTVTFFNVALAMSPIDIAITLPVAIPVVGVVMPAGSVPITFSFKVPRVVVELTKGNIAMWSKIGYLDFTRDEMNEAGTRRMDWRGTIYHVRKLGNKIVYYGESGVTFLVPSGVNMGMETINRVGIINKGGVAGDDKVNFFIDKNYKLNKLDDKLTMLDYSEFLSLLTTPVMSYDKNLELLYICDGTRGFIYSAKTNSFGEGPINVTGIDSRSGTLYVAAPLAITVPKFEICTDTYDCGTRKPKTIEEMEIGTDLTEDLYASIDYRTSYKDDFTQIGWFLVNPNGKAYPKCYGVEFRFRLKSMIYEYFEVDYIKLKGRIHGFSPLDTASNPLASLLKK